MASQTEITIAALRTNAQLQEQEIQSLRKQLKAAEARLREAVGMYENGAFSGDNLDRWVNNVLFLTNAIRDGGEGK